MVNFMIKKSLGDSKFHQNQDPESPSDYKWQTESLRDQAMSRQSEHHTIDEKQNLFFQPTSISDHAIVGYHQDNLPIAIWDAHGNTL